MDDTWNVPQYCQEDIDEEVGIATALEEDTKWWKDDGEDDFADVATVNIMLAMILINSASSSKSKTSVAEESGRTMVAVADEREVEIYLAVNAMMN